jgi:hypothetical protein
MLTPTHKSDSIGDNLVWKRDQSWHLCLVQLAKEAIFLMYEEMSVKPLARRGHSSPWIMKFHEQDP